MTKNKKSGIMLMEQNGKERICAIHQPNFFPWLGYFDKIARADVFVFLNQVDYPKSGNSMQCYTNRVGILKNGKAVWVHCPVVREHGRQRICDVVINNGTDWKNTLKQTIREYYKNSRYYQETSKFVDSLIDAEGDFISDYNINVIRRIMEKLGLDTPTIRQDDLNVKGHSTELLIGITKASGCDTYMCGGGAAKYQEDELFFKEGIKLLRQDFKERERIYCQKTEEFIPGLSILDALFHCGFEETKQLLKKK